MVPIFGATLQPVFIQDRQLFHRTVSHTLLQTSVCLRAVDIQAVITIITVLIILTSFFQRSSKMTQLGHTGRGNCAFVAPSAARCVTRAVRSAEWSLTRQPSIRIHDLWSRHVAQDGLLLGTTRRDTLHLCQFSLSLTTLRHCGQRQAHSTESQSSASTNLACLL